MLKKLYACADQELRGGRQFSQYFLKSKKYLTALHISIKDSQKYSQIGQRQPKTAMDSH
ncbi:unnamed protein product [Callosobruchus maculatus]|uniref:Uncharacterized protein n=1 Tax=Callosobruchus maculatus TaxID=64391 RepID=A0A653C4A1_CALMS|nr:unnamed protein product [Callosobruchus maculatus]